MARRFQLRLVAGRLTLSAMRGCRLLLEDRQRVCLVFWARDTFHPQRDR